MKMNSIQAISVTDWSAFGAFKNETVTVQFATNAAVTDLHLGNVGLFFAGTDRRYVEKPGNAGNGVEAEKQRCVFCGGRCQSRVSVFIPVPYDENWKCKVNGEDVSEKVTSIGGMMTIPVKEGTNEISLHYQAKGRVSGAVISFAAILLCFSVWLLQRKGFFGLHLQKAQTAAAWIVYILFMLAFAAFILLMFVLPAGYYMQTLSALDEVN